MKTVFYSIQEKFLTGASKKELARQRQRHRALMGRLEIADLRVAALSAWAMPGIDRTVLDGVRRRLSTAGAWLDKNKFRYALPSLEQAEQALDSIARELAGCTPALRRRLVSFLQVADEFLSSNEAGRLSVTVGPGLAPVLERLTGAAADDDEQLFAIERDARAVVHSLMDKRQAVLARRALAPLDEQALARSLAALAAIDSARGMCRRVRRSEVERIFGVVGRPKVSDLKVAVLGPAAELEKFFSAACGGNIGALGDEAGDGDDEPPPLYMWRLTLSREEAAYAVGVPAERVAGDERDAALLSRFPSLIVLAPDPARLGHEHAVAVFMSLLQITGDRLVLAVAPAAAGDADARPFFLRSIQRQRKGECRSPQDVVACYSAAVATLGESQARF